MHLLLMFSGPHFKKVINGPERKLAGWIDVIRGLRFIFSPNLKILLNQFCVSRYKLKNCRIVIMN